jgi:hypothetical protein
MLIPSSTAQTLETTFVIEDPVGRILILHLYNLPSPGIETGPDLDAFLPLGQALAIREPTVKGGVFHSRRLHVDSPTDIIFLKPTDPVLRDIEWSSPSPAKPLPPSFDYKEYGNTLFKQNKYLLAVKAYSDGLAASPSDEQKLLLYLNRSQAHLLLRNFASAYRDTSSVLCLLDDDISSLPLTGIKVYLRQARALEGMKKLEMALEAYNKVVELDSTYPSGKDGIKRVTKMLQQAKTGEFDWKDRAKMKLSEKCGSSAGDFFGPIQIGEIEGRGGKRSVVAARDIEADELVLGSFTFLFVFEVDAWSSSSFQRLHCAVSCNKV